MVDCWKFWCQRNEHASENERLAVLYDSLSNFYLI
jgi:hypothetical protein